MHAVNDARTRVLLLCGPAGCLLFMISVLVHGFLRENYRWYRYPASSLSLGKYGWIQMLTFMISGIMIVLFATGLRQSTKGLKNSKWITWLIGAVGIGLTGAGIFSTDPAFGYPENEPLMLSQVSLSGHLHDLFSILVFTCLPIACFKFRNRFKEAGLRGWATYSMLSGMGMLVTFILAGAGFKQAPILVDVAGVMQRLSILTGFMWMILLAFFILRTNFFNQNAAPG